MADLNPHYGQLMEALTNAAKYPRNDCGIEGQEHFLRALEEHFNRRTPDLFGPKSKVHFLEVYRQNEGPCQTVISDSSTLERHLRQPFEKQQRPDLPQRFIFIRAPDSKSPLQIDRQMLLQILTYHQVTPVFLDFVCYFGRQLHDDFHISGLRSETCLDRRRVKLHIPQLERSGRQIELCYSLKSVERSRDTWAVRPCSVHHKFDVESQQASWIIVKANKLMQDTIKQHLHNSAQTSTSQPFDKERSPLANSLSIHRAVCDWAGDNWHRYITDLEAQLQEGTRRTLYDPQEVIETSPPCFNESPSDAGAQLPRRTSMRTVKSFKKAFKRTASSLTWRDGQSTLQGYDLPSISPESEKPEISVPIEDYRFGNLQEIQRSEDRFNSILLTLKANSRVVRDLQREYAKLEGSTDPVVGECQLDLDDFQYHLGSVVKTLEMQQTRLETLIKIAADRKSLVQGILQYRNMLATQQFAVRAQETAEDMKYMTQQMHRIADKTVIETVSMKIITVITLIFLPATFISTLMSTPIVRFTEPTSGFSTGNLGIGALKLYLAATIPLTLITFLAVFAWLAWYLRGRKRRIVLDDCDKMV